MTRKFAGKWARSCKRSPAVTLVSAIAAGYFIGVVLRIFERRK